jgi:hypothetical protein
LTNRQKITYNKGVAIKCSCCGKTLAFLRNGKIYIKCRFCKQESNVTDVELKPRARATEE